MVESKRIRVERAADRKDFAEFMKGEQIYEIPIEFVNPEGTVYEIPIVYTPATAFDLAVIYGDFDKNEDTEGQFEYTAQLFNFCIKGECGVRFVNCPKGEADYEKGEISVRDLTVESKSLLEAAFSPGVGKSGQELEQKLKVSRRKIGKGGRRKNSVGVDAGTIADLSL